jgi:hypothetical protein
MPIITHIQPIVFCLWAVKPIRAAPRLTIKRRRRKLPRRWPLKARSSMAVGISDVRYRPRRRIVA